MQPVVGDCGWLRLISERQHPQPGCSVNAGGGSARRIVKGSMLQGAKDCRLEVNLVQLGLARCQVHRQV